MVNIRYIMKYAIMMTEFKDTGNIELSKHEGEDLKDYFRFKGNEYIQYCFVYDTEEIRDSKIPEIFSELKDGVSKFPWGV